jgi:hypothetical protein
MLHARCTSARCDFREFPAGARPRGSFLEKTYIDIVPTCSHLDLELHAFNRSKRGVHKQAVAVVFFINALFGTVPLYLRKFAIPNILVRVPSRLRAYKASVFQALAHPTRIAVQEFLRDGELSAGARGKNSASLCQMHAGFATGAVR